MEEEGAEGSGAQPDDLVRFKQHRRSAEASAGQRAARTLRPTRDGRRDPEQLFDAAKEDARVAQAQGARARGGVASRDGVQERVINVSADGSGRVELGIDVPVEDRCVRQTHAPSAVRGWALPYSRCSFGRAALHIRRNTASAGGCRVGSESRAAVCDRPLRR